MNVRYYLDTEFNSYGGSLISLGIVRHDDPADNLYLVVPQTDIERMTVAEGMDPWIIKNILPILYSLPNKATSLTTPAHKWGQALSQFIYREGETPHIFVDWPSDAMDFCKLLITGPGQAVDMGNQTIITILRHVDIYPTSLSEAVQHNALWDAMAIRQFVHEMEDKKPETPIERLGRPIKHDSETQAAIKRIGGEFHKTRLSHNVSIDPGDLSLALKALGYYD